MAKRVKNYYTSNPILRDEIEKSRAAGKLTDRLAKAIMMIAEGLGRKSNWAGYSYRDEMVADAIVQMCAGWHKFDPAKSDNPFAYLSTIAANSFRRTLSVNKKQGDILDDLAWSAGMSPSLHYEFKPRAGRKPVGSAKTSKTSAPDKAD